MSLHHYNNEGIVDECSAETVASCPFQGNGHYDTAKEAEQAFERSMESHTYDHSATSSTKTINNLKRSISSLSEQAQQCSADDDARRVELYQEIGDHVLQTVEQLHNVSFHHNKPIEDQETLNSIGAAFQDVIRHLDDQRAPDQYALTGTQHKATQEAVSVLPSALIEARNAQGSIFTETVHGNTIQKDGVYYPRKRIETYSKTPDGIDNYDKIILEKVSLQDQEVYSGYISPDEVSNVENGRQAAQGMQYDAKTDSYRKVFVGKPSGKTKGTRYKKIADNIQLKTLYHDETVTVNAPLYAQYTAKPSQEEVIASKTAKSLGNTDQQHSVLLHEYTHSIQHSLDNPHSGMESGEMHFFSSLRQGEPSRSSNYGVETYGGFPSDYMGNVSGRELLPCAVQHVLRPRREYDGQSLFEQHNDPVVEQNRRKILSWVTGYLATWTTKKDAE